MEWLPVLQCDHHHQNWHQMQDINRFIIVIATMTSDSSVLGGRWEIPTDFYQLIPACAHTVCDTMYTSTREYHGEEVAVFYRFRFLFICSCVRVDLIEKYNFQFALNNFLCTAVWDKVLQRSTGAVSQSQRDRKRVRERAREPESQASIRDAVRKKQDYLTTGC